MKGNKKRLNKQKADRRHFAIAYQKAQAIKRKKERLSKPDTYRDSKSEYDEFRYLRVKEDDLRCIEYWNIDSTAAVLIAPRLRAFVKGVERYGATPGSYYDIDKEGNFVKGGWRLNDSILDQPDDDRLDAVWQGWHSVLKKMQYAFDTLEKNTYGMKASLFYELSDEEARKVQDGLLLFAKNYFYLWY